VTLQFCGLLVGTLIIALAMAADLVYDLTRGRE